MKKRFLLASATVVLTAGMISAAALADNAAAGNASEGKQTSDSSWRQSHGAFEFVKDGNNTADVYIDSADLDTLNNKIGELKKEVGSTDGITVNEAKKEDGETKTNDKGETLYKIYDDLKGSEVEVPKSDLVYKDEKIIGYREVTQDTDDSGNTTIKVVYNIDTDGDGKIDYSGSINGKDGKDISGITSDNQNPGPTDLSGKTVVIEKKDGSTEEVDFSSLAAKVKANSEAIDGKITDGSTKSLNLTVKYTKAENDKPATVTFSVDK